MPEINLLQTRIKDNTFAWQKQAKGLLSFLVVVLVLLAALGGGFWFLTQRLTTQAQTLDQTNTQIQAQLNQKEQTLGDATVFQAQVANIKTLLANHVYITPFLTELGNMTYSKTQYVTVDAADSGKIHVEGQVDSYAGLAKLLLGLNTSKEFSNVELLSVAPSSGQTNGYVFAIDLTASPDLFVSAK